LIAIFAAALIATPVYGQAAVDRGSTDRIKAELRQLYSELNAAIAARTRLGAYEILPVLG
jgi:hypothetical protein